MEEEEEEEVPVSGLEGLTARERRNRARALFSRQMHRAVASEAKAAARLALARRNYTSVKNKERAWHAARARESAARARARAQAALMDPRSTFARANTSLRMSTGGAAPQDWEGKRSAARKEINDARSYLAAMSAHLRRTRRAVALGS